MVFFTPTVDPTLNHDICNPEINFHHSAQMLTGKLTTTKERVMTQEERLLTSKMIILNERKTTSKEDQPTAEEEAPKEEKSEDKTCLTPSFSTSSVVTPNGP